VHGDLGDRRLGWRCPRGPTRDSSGGLGDGGVDRSERTRSEECFGAIWRHSVFWERSFCSSIGIFSCAGWITLNAWFSFIISGQIIGASITEAFEPDAGPPGDSANDSAGNTPSDSPEDPSSDSTDNPASNAPDDPVFHAYASSSIAAIASIGHAANDGPYFSTGCSAEDDAHFASVVQVNQTSHTTQAILICPC